MAHIDSVLDDRKAAYVSAVRSTEVNLTREAGSFLPRSTAAQGARGPCDSATRCGYAGFVRLTG